MSVPSALVAILTIEPAYGLQLHSELGSRLPHRASTNVGQIYSTLERLVRDKLVERAGETTDGLPLYRATEHGMHASRVWLSGESVTKDSSWAEILDVLLLGTTIAGAPVAVACSHVKSQFELNSESTDLAQRASHHYAQAVNSMIADIERATDTNTLPVHGFTQERPVRGRKPRIEL